MVHHSPPESKILESSARRNTMDARMVRQTNQEFRELMFGSQAYFENISTGELTKEIPRKKNSEQTFSKEVLNELFD